ncbi:MAG TPA: aminopeptidase N, partial [Pseudolabrys sp.]|nr:aminopeptidase N [Pseudolabrys sp.]
RPPSFLIDEVNLEFRLEPSATRVKARLAVRRNGRHTEALRLDGVRLKLIAVCVDGQALDASAYTVTDEDLSVPGVPDAFTLETEVEIDPAGNTALEGLYMSGGRFCTQCEAEGFRKITYYPDRPDVLSRFTVRIVADQAFHHLLSNGNLMESGELPGGRHFAVWNDPFPKPCYLFALVAGELDMLEDSFVTMSGRDVALRIYVDPGQAARAAYAMDALKRAMKWDEETYGREYDLDLFMIVAVRDFNFGAMENKGLNIFNSSLLLADPETATDADYERIESVVAHEYFHNWTGDRITCRDWFQLCLKEGLTVFRDQEFSADERSRPVKRVADVRMLRTTQFVEDAGPLAHPVRPTQYKEINNFYTTTIYEKGAEVVRMIKTLLGADKFREGMDLYFQRHDGEAATIEQFVQCFADVSKRDMTQFMRWYSQSGTPEVIASGTYDAQRKTYRLEIGQAVPSTPGQLAKEPMVIPLAFGLIDKNGRDLIGARANGSATPGVLVLDQPAQKWEFNDIDERPVLSINRGFSAPVRLTANLSTEDLAFLAAHDSDAFNRWNAVQALAIRALLETITRFPAGGQMRPAEGLITALAAILADDEQEPAFVALALTPPSETDIAREIGRDIDPDAIHRAYADLRASIGSRLRDALAATYTRLTGTAPFTPDAVSAGRRALRNVCLDLLAATGQDDAIVHAARQYETADNMTDRSAALSTLSQHATPQREAALDDFYKRYADNPLIIDKWLSLQASIPEPQTLDRVRALTAHPAFAMTNPNRVRALIGAFAHSNPREFNRADGAGYDFVADKVLVLDPANPQVAARLATAFRSWRMLESGRRGKAEAAMRRIMAVTTLSRDVADIVERSLAG